jgi:hypothetical protein
MGGEDVLALNQEDRDRLKELHAVVRGRPKVREAAWHLGVSPRQVRRLSRPSTCGARGAPLLASSC